MTTEQIGKQEKTTHHETSRLTELNHRSWKYT